MPVALGSSSIKKMYLGETEIKKAYLGATEIFSSGGPTPVHRQSFSLASYGTGTHNSLQFKRWIGAADTTIIDPELRADPSNVLSILQVAFWSNGSITLNIRGDQSKSQDLSSKWETDGSATISGSGLNFTPPVLKPSTIPDISQPYEWPQNTILRSQFNGIRGTVSGVSVPLSLVLADG